MSVEFQDFIDFKMTYWIEFKRKSRKGWFNLLHIFMYNMSNGKQVDGFRFN